MIVAHEVGMSEEEFWHSCPIFFNEIAKRYMDLKQQRFGLGGRNGR
jgi:hypothetical protein